MVHVCFGLHDKSGHYSKFTGTAMLSIFENTDSPITVHILHDNTLTFDNRDKFSYVAGKYNQRVKFYNVEELCADRIEQIKQLVPNITETRFSIATFYRFLIPRLLSEDIEKIIYLDSDIVVNLDLKEFWNVELDDRVFGVIPEILNKADVHETYPLCRDSLVKTENYFNAGVLLINLKVFQSEMDTISDAFKFVAENPQYSCFLDQDLLNYCFSEKVMHLPIKFNRFVSWARKSGDTFISNKIYHYVVNTLDLDMSDPFNRLWMDYFIKTPWFDSEALGRLYNSYRQIYNGLKNAWIKLLDAAGGKTRVFFILKDYLDLVTKTFTLRNDEEIIFIENGAPLQKIADLMESSRNRNFFIVMFPGFPFGTFVEAGFVYGKDFVNGFEFLSEAQGFPLNSYELIKAM